jgi:hypothetical protein
MTVTTDIRDKKLAERDRLLAEAEATLGTHAEHLEDDDILATGWVIELCGGEVGRAACGRGTWDVDDLQQLIHPTVTVHS